MKIFFHQYCLAAEIAYNNGEEEIIFIKDSTFTFHYVSKAYKARLDQTGIIPMELVKCIKSKKLKESEFVKIIQQQDQIIKTLLTPKTFIFIDVYNQMGFIRKRPIINPATNNFVGILGNVRPFILPNMLNLIYKMNGIDFGLANTENPSPLRYQLTQRQHIVLFFYINKYSNTEIASIMVILGHKISAGRINDHLENLKYIFAVRTKEQLIETAISYKYHLFIPRQLLKVGSFPLDDEIVISN